MQSGRALAEKRLSSEATTFWKDFFPNIWTIGVGAGMVGVWLNLLGEPTSIEIKVLGGMIWVGTSILFNMMSRTLHEVWLRGDQLVVSVGGRKVPIPLDAVTAISETRGQKIKTIKVKLRPGSPLGTEIRFIPPMGLHAPFSDHPVVREIQDRKRQLAGSRGPRELSR